MDEHETSPGLNAASGGLTSVPETVHRLNSSRARRLLLSNACVITMDPAVGNFESADILIEGSLIKEIGPGLSSRVDDRMNTTVVDASDTIAIPGLVDAHRHMWQGQLRRMVPNVDIPVYLGLRNAVAVQYRPHDNYVGTLANALGALNSGITTIQDLSHNTRSTEHADAGIEALSESGIRSVFAYAPPEAGDWDRQWPGDLARVKSERLAGEDGMLTLRMAQRCVSDVDNLDEERIRIARELGIGMTIDPVAWEDGSAAILRLASEGLLGPDLAFVHCSDLSEGAWEAMGEAGVKVILSPFVDELLGFDTHAERLPTVQRALDVGIRPALSVDIETTVPGEMFTQMRSVLAVQRMRGSLGNPESDRPQLTARDVLSFATLDGSETIGLGEICGTLSPGKKADLVLIDQSGPSGFPLNNAFGAVVMGADSEAVRCVMVDGIIKKWGHSLVGVDLAAVRSMLYESRDYLLSKIGYQLDPFVDYPTIDLGPPKYRP